MVACARALGAVGVCGALLAACATTPPLRRPVRPPPPGVTLDRPTRLTRAAALCETERESGVPRTRVTSRALGVTYLATTDPERGRHGIGQLERLGDDGATLWAREVARVSLAGVASNGDAVLAQWGSRITRVTPEGETLWTLEYEPSHRCGAQYALALGGDGDVWLGCGYSLLRITADGRVAWQRWPLGNHTVSSVLVDARGTAYVAASGDVAAVDRAGVVRWRASAGFNRWIPRLALRPGGNLVFCAMQEAAHSEDTGSGHYYYEQEAPVVIELARDGREVQRVELPFSVDRDAGPSEPAGYAPTSDGAHRAP